MKLDTIEKCLRRLYSYLNSNLADEQEFKEAGTMEMRGEMDEGRILCKFAPVSQKDLK